MTRIAVHRIKASKPLRPALLEIDGHPPLVSPRIGPQPVDQMINILPVDRILSQAPSRVELGTVCACQVVVPAPKEACVCQQTRHQDTNQDVLPDGDGGMGNRGILVGELTAGFVTGKNSQSPATAVV